MKRCRDWLLSLRAFRTGSWPRHVVALSIHGGFQDQLFFSTLPQGFSSASQHFSWVGFFTLTKPLKPPVMLHTSSSVWDLGSVDDPVWTEPDGLMFPSGMTAIQAQVIIPPPPCWAGSTGCFLRPSWRLVSAPVPSVQRTSRPSSRRRSADLMNLQIGSMFPEPSSGSKVL